MKWLKWIGAALLTALTLGLVRPGARKWQEKAVDNEQRHVEEDLAEASEANAKAKEHDDAAREIKAEAEKERKNESTDSIVDRWG